jgi:hypothetical protein
MRSRPPAAHNQTIITPPSTRSAVAISHFMRSATSALT